MTKSKLIIGFILLSFLAKTYAQECYTLVWSDEFEGTKLDMNKWSFQNGSGYPVLTDWGNQELQYYTDRPENVSVNNGTLKLITRRENLGGKQYTSGRIKSKGNFDFKYGKIEGKIKIASGSSLWPAFWLLPSENVFGAWPLSGEIDIMENYGNTDVIGSTIHFKDGNNNNTYNDQSRRVTMDTYHDFVAVWEQNLISFYVDGLWIGNESPTDLRGGRWPFNENFFLILNQAMNERRAGSPNTTTFPKTMEIDYIRVYQRTTDVQIEGPKSVYPNQTVSFKLPANTSATYNWTPPIGGAILAGQGTNEVTVKWGNTNGNIQCSSANWNGVNDAGLTRTCLGSNHSKPVAVITKNCDIPLLNFDGVQKLLSAPEDGVGGIEAMFEKNEFKNSVNNSSHVGRFARVGSQTYDVLKLNFTEPIDVSSLKTAANKLKMDVYSTAPGTSIPVTIELVNRAENTGYPRGVHSQFTGNITTTNNWQTVTFNYVNTPDPSVSGAAVDGINILFNTNTNTTNVYYFDNLATTLPITGKISGTTTISNLSIDNSNTYTITPQLGAVYNWVVGANTTILSGQNTSNLNVNFRSGIYKSKIDVTLINSMQCSYPYSLDVIVSATNALEKNFITENIDVFPNPTRDLFSIYNKSNQSMKYKLLDSKGIITKEGVLNELQNIDISDFNVGIYFLTVYNTELSQTYKVVKN